MAIGAQSGLRPVPRIAPPLIVPPPDGLTALPVPPDERIVVEPKPLLLGLVPAEPRDDPPVGARIGWLYTWPPDLTAAFPAVGLGWDVNVCAPPEPRYTMGLPLPALPPVDRVVAPTNCGDCCREPRYTTGPLPDVFPPGALVVEVNDDVLEPLPPRYTTGPLERGLLSAVLTVEPNVVPLVCEPRNTVGPSPVAPDPGFVLPAPFGDTASA